MRKTIEQKIADLQRKQRFELLRSNVKEHIAEVKAAMASCIKDRARDIGNLRALQAREKYELDTIERMLRGKVQRKRRVKAIPALSEASLNVEK